MAGASWDRRMKERLVVDQVTHKKPVFVRVRRANSPLVEKWWIMAP